MRPLAALLAATMLTACAGGDEAPSSDPATFGPSPRLDRPWGARLFPVLHIAPAATWPEGAAPTPAPGLRVTAFARGLEHPRWVYVLPNGDVLVAESNAPPKDQPGGPLKKLKAWIQSRVMARAGAGVPSADRITLLRDADGDGTAELRTVLVEDLYSPFGMAWVSGQLYVANADAVVAFPFQPGQTHIDAAPRRVTGLPGGPLNHHWTKNILASPDGARLYATVGSNSNVGENGMVAEEGRAAIWEIDLATGDKRLFATGLRNPNGLDWNPEGDELWTAVNERDELGNDLVPDYMTSVRRGGFYGWPYSYFGQTVDVRVQPPRPDLVARAVAPDYALGAHTASLGLVFARGEALPAQFRNGAFVGQHGSWNRTPRAGYKVIFVPFAGGRPSGPPVDVLTGFVNAEGEAQGRPVGVAIDGRGGLLVADDVGNVIWRVGP